MLNNVKKFSLLITGSFVSVLLASCVTETVDSDSSLKFSDTAIIAVQDPYVIVHKGSTFAWLSAAVDFHDDKRLGDPTVKKRIEDEIEKNLRAKGVVLVDSVNGARYSFGYTAALESSLNDETIIRRFGLLPGNSQVPKNDSSIEKGTLIIYVYENKTNSVIWRSAAQVGVKFDKALEKRKEHTRRIIAEMFQSFNVVK